MEKNPFRHIKISNLKQKVKTSGTRRYVQFGDILFSLPSLGKKLTTKSIHSDVHLWYKGVMPIEFHSKVKKDDKQKFWAACKIWSDVANVRCVSRKNQKHYVLVMDHTEDLSYIGRIGGKQEIHKILE